MPPWTTCSCVHEFSSAFWEACLHFSHLVPGQFFLCLPPSLCFALCMNGGIHNKLKNALSGNDGDYQLLLCPPLILEDRKAHQAQPFAQLCMQLASTSAPLEHHNRASAAAHLDPPVLQPRRFEVAIRCHTSLPASMLWFSFLFSERTPKIQFLTLQL